MTQFHEITAGGESGNIAPDPGRSGHRSTAAPWTSSTRRAGQTEDVDPTLAYPDIYRGDWTLPLIFSPKDHHALYFANQHLFRTRDGGKHWALLSPDLTRRRSRRPANLDAPTAADTATVGARRGVIYAIAPSRFNTDDIWVGTDDGLIWRTHDDGKHWADVTPERAHPLVQGGIIEAGHFSADTAYRRHRPPPSGRLQALYLLAPTTAARAGRAIVDGIPDGSFRQRGARGSGEARSAVRRHRTRHLSVLRRRRPLADPAAEPAGDLHPRHRSCTATIW